MNNEGNKFQFEESGNGKNDSRGISTKEKILVLLVIVLLIIVIVMMIVVTYLATYEDIKDNIDVCVTPQCTKSAANVLQGIDFSVNPCDNFYEFACGGWMKKRTAPDFLSAFGELRNGVALTIKNLLEKENQPNEVEAIVKAKDLYQSCLNLSRIEERGLTPILSLITEFGGWPLLGNATGGRWEESSFDLTDLLMKVIKYYRVIVLNFYAYTDMKNSSANVLYFEQPGFGMAKRYILGDVNSSEWKSYRKLATEVIKAFGADVTIIEDEMNDVFALERDLANITVAPDRRRDVDEEYNVFTVGNLHQNFNESKLLKFSWQRFIKELYHLDGVTSVVQDSDIVIVKQPSYFEKMTGVLENYSKRTISNYVIWLLVKGRLWDLPNNIRVILNEYRREMSGFDTDPPRWKDCSKFTSNFMGLATGRLFVEETFDRQSKVEMRSMIHDIKDAFKGSLEKLHWLAESTKVAALEKSEAMASKIGYEDFILDDAKLNKEYEDFIITRTDYFENVIYQQALRSVNNLNRIGKLVDKNKWTTAPSVVNAFYSPEMNRIMFPAGILQPPYYHKDQPKSLNYGGIGFMIGHEITHGFDDNGRQYDKNGDLKQWWDKESIEAFKNRTECFVDQYGDYSFPEAGGRKLDGVQTLGENIADNGGIKQCYMAYQKWVEMNGREEPRLPGVNLTHNQLLFVNIAQQRCTIMNEKKGINAIVSGVHSPARFRVIGTMQNFKEFSKVFNCPVGSYMNPVRKCEIW